MRARYRFRVVSGVLVAVMFGAGVSRAAAPALPAAAGTVVVTLGTAGGPRPRADRSQSANLLIVSGTPYLIDAGENVVRRIAEAGVDPVAVGTVFITHGHSDHTLGLPALLATQWEFNRRTPIDIIGPAGTRALTDGALAFLSVNTAIRASEGYTAPIATIVAARDAIPGVVFRDAKIVVTAVENAHFHFPRGSPGFGRYASFAYRFATPDRVVVFTGDTGPSPAVTALARGADVLVTEISSPNAIMALYVRNGTWARKTAEEQRDWLRHQRDEHLSPRAVGEMATAAGVKMVVLTHLTPVADPIRDYAAQVAEVRQYFAGEVKLASDLDRF